MAPSEGRDPLLGDAEIEELTSLAAEVKARIPAADGLPWDIEFGIYQGNPAVKVRQRVIEGGPALNLTNEAAGAY